MLGIGFYRERNMSIIFGIMKEEYSRLDEAQIVYREKISCEIKGSPRIKHIGKKDYLYLVKRKDDKVIYKYIGEIHSAKAVSALESIKRRRKNEESLKKVQKDLKEVKKVLRGKI